MVHLDETSDQVGTTRRIYLSLLRQIEAGVFAVGASLPSSRSLAEELGVSRKTVIAAFDQLISEGYVRASQGKRPTVVSVGRPGEIKQDRDRHVADQSLSDYATRAMALPTNSSAGRPLLKFDFRYATYRPTISHKRRGARLLRRPSLLIASGTPMTILLVTSPCERRCMVTSGDRAASCAISIRSSSSMGRSKRLTCAPGSSSIQATRLSWKILVMPWRATL